MRIDVNWLYAVAGLVLGFILNILFEELKSPRLAILGASPTPFSISAEVKIIGTGYDNDFAAYR